MNRLVSLTTCFMIASMFVCGQSYGQESKTQDVAAKSLAIHHAQCAPDSCHRPIRTVVKNTVTVARNSVCRTGRAVRRVAGCARNATRNTIRGSLKLTRRILSFRWCR